MSNITDSLKNLYVAFGGNADDVATLSNITDISNAIATLLGGEGNATSISEAIQNIVPVVPSGGNEYADMLKGVIERTATSFIVPDFITEIGPNAFNGMDSLTTLVIPGTVENIAARSISYCQYLTNVTISEGVKSIGFSAFEGCFSIETINIPNSVTSMDEGVFENCTGLKSVTIGNGLSYLESDTFEGCTALTSITINKPQNSISGAPWGATNATVTWTG